MHEAESNRDLQNYLKSYSDLPFERVAEHFRRKEVLGELAALGTLYLAEVGCGLDSIFNHVDEQVRGMIIEPIQDLLDVQVDLNSEILRVCTRLEDRPREFSQKFDTVLLSSILHEIGNPREFLASAVDLLTEEGHVVCVVPNAYSLHRLVGWKKGILESPESRTATQDLMQQIQLTFTPESIVQLFRSQNLKVVECRTFFPKLLSHAQMQSLLDDGLIDSNFIDMLCGLSRHLEPVGSEIMIIGKKQ